MISTLLDRLFQRSNVPSGAQVKQRLKFILAHDRAAIEPKVFEKMRHEIMRVVSKYVELDEGSLDIRLESDKRMTALIANLPIRMVREELSDLEALFDSVPEQVEDVDKSDSSTIEMDLSAEVALAAIAAKEIVISLPENATQKNIELISESNISTIISEEGTSEDGIENLIKDENEQLEEQPSDQLELLLEVADSLAMPDSLAVLNANSS
jgi:cell division topological specificity factor